MDQTIERARHARAKSKSGQVELFVHPEELGFWVNFFLKAYRDGMAEVSHISRASENVTQERQKVMLISTFPTAI